MTEYSHTLYATFQDTWQYILKIWVALQALPELRVGYQGSDSIFCQFKFCYQLNNQVILQQTKWTIPLKEAASLLWYFYRDPLRSLTLLSLNDLNQKS